MRSSFNDIYEHTLVNKLEAKMLKPEDLNFCLSIMRLLKMKIVLIINELIRDNLEILKGKCKEKFRLIANVKI